MAGGQISHAGPLSCCPRPSTGRLKTARVCGLECTHPRMHPAATHDLNRHLRPQRPATPSRHANTRNPAAMFSCGLHRSLSSCFACCPATAQSHHQPLLPSPTHIALPLTRAAGAIRTASGLVDKAADFVPETVPRPAAKAGVAIAGVMVVFWLLQKVGDGSSWHTFEPARRKNRGHRAGRGSLRYPCVRGRRWRWADVSNYKATADMFRPLTPRCNQLRRAPVHVSAMCRKVGCPTWRGAPIRAASPAACPNPSAACAGTSKYVIRGCSACAPPDRTYCLLRASSHTGPHARSTQRARHPTPPTRTAPNAPVCCSPPFPCRAGHQRRGDPGAVRGRGLLLPDAERQGGRRRRRDPQQQQRQEGRQRRRQGPGRPAVGGAPHHGQVQVKWTSRSRRRRAQGWGQGLGPRARVYNRPFRKRVDVMKV